MFEDRERIQNTEQCPALSLAPHEPSSSFPSLHLSTDCLRLLVVSNSVSCAASCSCRKSQNQPLSMLILCTLLVQVPCTLTVFMYLLLSQRISGQSFQLGYCNHSHSLSMLHICKPLFQKCPSQSQNLDLEFVFWQTHFNALIKNHVKQRKSANFERLE